MSKTSTEIAAVENNLPSTVVTPQDVLAMYLAMREQGQAIPADAPKVKLNNYTELAEGKNRFSLLAQPIYGAEVWVKQAKVNEETGELEYYEDGSVRYDRKVVRIPAGKAIMVPAVYRDWVKERPRKFMALLVFNHKSSNVEILIVTKKQLFESLESTLRFDADNLNPFKADLKIEMTKDGKQKSFNGNSYQPYNYSVTQTKELPPSEAVKTALLALPTIPNLRALFKGEDPFDAGTPVEVIEEYDQHKAAADAATAQAKEQIANAKKAK